MMFLMSLEMKIEWQPSIQEYSAITFRFTTIVIEFFKDR
jgi:hypothetical protein